MKELLFKIYLMSAFLGIFFAVPLTFLFLKNLIITVYIKLSKKDSSQPGQLTLNPVKLYFQTLTEKYKDNNLTDSEKNMNVAFGIITLIGFIHLLVWSGTYLNIVGNTQIGSYFEKRNYTENYYVMLSEYVPYTKTPENKCQAIITKDGDYYYIEEATHPDGFTLDFQGSYIELDEWIFCDDQIGVTWDVLLTSTLVP